MPSFFRKRSHLKPSTNKQQKAKRARAQLSLERLEDRLVLSSSSSTIVPAVSGALPELRPPRSRQALRPAKRGGQFRGNQRLGTGSRAPCP